MKLIMLTVVTNPHVATELSLLSLDYLSCQNDTQTESAALTSQVMTRELIQFNFQKSSDAIG